MTDPFRLVASPSGLTLCRVGDRKGVALQPADVQKRLRQGRRLLLARACGAQPGVSVLDGMAGFGLDGLTRWQRVSALHLFAAACYRLGKFSIALFALERAEREMDSPEAPRHLDVQLAALKGNLLALTGAFKEALAAYERAVRGYEELGTPFEACRCRLNLTSALIEAGDQIAVAVGDHDVEENLGDLDTLFEGGRRFLLSGRDSGEQAGDQAAGGDPAFAAHYRSLAPRRLISWI